MTNSSFTPEQIQEILNIYFENFAHRQYIGQRYVPIFGRKGEESIEWDNTGTYEPLTIVLYQGNSYTSRQFVPIGVEITNENYWAQTGNYNAQVEAYRQEVLGFQDELDNLSDTVGNNYDDLVFQMGTLENTLLGQIESKFPITTAQIRDNAVTNAKIADSAITNAKIADNAVTNAKIADNAISSTKLGENSVQNRAILNGSVTTEKLADNSVTSAKIDSSVLRPIENQLAGTTNSGLLTLINKYKRKPLVDATYFYIDYINGNDNNDGLTAATAFKTVDRFLQEETNGYTDLYCYMISTGTYRIHDHRITNTSIHFYSTAPDVILFFDFTSAAMCYNAYLHFEGTADSYLRVHFGHINSPDSTYGFHADASVVYAHYVRFTGQGVFDISLGTVQFNSVEMNMTPPTDQSNMMIRISQGMLQNVSFNYANPSRYLIHMQGSLVFLTGTFTPPTYGANSTGGIFRLQGTMFFASPVYSLSNVTFDNVVKMEQSFMQLPDGQHNTLISRAAGGSYTGNQSVVNHKYSINDIS